MPVDLIFVIIGFVGGFLSGAVGCSGGLIIIPAITSLFGVEVAVPVSAVAQLMSNASKAIIGFRKICWRKVIQFSIFALPFTALGAFGFAIAPRVTITRIICVCLVAFAFMTFMGKLRLPSSRPTMFIGGAITGSVNGLVGLYGPLSSSVFLTLNLSPVPFIATEGLAAASMHIVRAYTYHALGFLGFSAIIHGVIIGAMMMLGNFVAMRLIRHINKKFYNKLVLGVIILVSVWLFITVK